MSITAYNIKKWTRMCLGKSILHVDQGEGKIYSIEEIKGYYNDLTEKVTKLQEIGKNNLPFLNTEDGRKIEFPIQIFQYGLGAYDLYLINQDESMLEKFYCSVNWAIENQGNNGEWNSIGYKYPDAPYSSMAQGEGASLLLRAYVETKKDLYLNAAKKALEFMLISNKDGGTAWYRDNEIFLLEYACQPVILNGWIFSIFGLIDYLKISPNDEYIKNKYEATLQSLENNLKHYDKKFWSMYDIKDRIASPFYHKVHINQLKVLYKITNREIFNEYSKKFERYKNNIFFRAKALMIKIMQKIKEK